MGNGKAVLPRHRILQPFNLRGSKLNDVPAFNTDHMVVVTACSGAFEARTFVAEARSSYQAGTGEEF